MNSKGEIALDWLLDEDTPDIRALALRDLVHLSAEDAEMRRARTEAHRRGPIPLILENMNEEGFWVKPGPGYSPKYTSTVWTISLLAQLGADIREDERIGKACSYLLDHALTPAGQFSYSGAPSGTIDCLQGNLVYALTRLGCTDLRLDLACDWMARTVTGEGIAPASEKDAKERYYAYKCGAGFCCGANDKLPCAWGATKVLLALSAIPAEKRSAPVQRAIVKGDEFFFSVDPATAAYPCANNSKPNQSWWKFGFPVFYITDLLQVAEALAAPGSANNPRMKGLLDLILKKQDEQGRWALEYDYQGKTWGDFGKKKEPNKYVTLRAMRVLQVAGVK